VRRWHQSGRGAPESVGSKTQRAIPDFSAAQSKLEKTFFFSNNLYLTKIYFIITFFLTGPRAQGKKKCFFAEKNLVRNNTKSN
jgi:hypothetical protein